MIVKLKQTNSDYPDLSITQHYVVIGIEADDLRIINDQGLPYLYPQEIFSIIDRAEPSDWIVEAGEDGERYAYPPRLNAPGFFEDFFDRKPEAVAAFWHIINSQLTLAAAAD